jgi:hypothetical protein
VSGVYGIAINPATKWIIAHSSWANPNIILILDPNGILKGAYTYAEIPNYHKFWRNLLLGYDSLTLTYTALIQTKLSSNLGYKLFSFTLSSSSSAPTFKWGFNSFFKTINDIGFSIIFSSF